MLKIKFNQNKKQRYIGIGFALLGIIIAILLPIAGVNVWIQRMICAFCGFIAGWLIAE